MNQTFFFGPCDSLSPTCKLPKTSGTFRDQNFPPQLFTQKPMLLLLRLDGPGRWIKVMQKRIQFFGLSLPGCKQVSKWKMNVGRFDQKQLSQGFHFFGLHTSGNIFFHHSILLNEFDTQSNGLKGQIAQANFFPVFFWNGLKNWRVQWGKHKCWKMKHWLRCKSWLLPHVATLHAADMLSIRPHATKPWNASSHAVAFVRPPGIVGNMSMDIIRSLSWKTVALIVQCTWEVSGCIQRHMPHPSLKNWWSFTSTYILEGFHSPGHPLTLPPLF